MSTIINETFEIRQQSLFQACSSDDGKIKYIVSEMSHFPMQLNASDPQLESARKFFATKNYCVLISEQIVTEAKNRIEVVKKEIIENFGNIFT